jgi:hypothetical protein
MGYANTTGRYETRKMTCHCPKIDIHRSISVSDLTMVRSHDWIDFKHIPPKGVLEMECR